MAKRRNGQCAACGAWVDGLGRLCDACSAPVVVRATRVVRATFKREPEELVVNEAPEHPLCEDAPACLQCRERLGLGLLPGLG